MCEKANLSMLNGVTISGKVRFWAIVRGTPTWSIDKLGSGVITARAEKSTRFPIRFPLTRPSLLFNLCFTDFSGRPDFCMACGQSRKHILMSLPHFVIYCNCYTPTLLNSQMLLLRSTETLKLKAMAKLGLIQKQKHEKIENSLPAEVIEHAGFHVLTTH